MGDTLGLRGRPKEKIHVAEWILGRNAWFLERPICLDFYYTRPESKSHLVKNLPTFLLLFSALMILGSQYHRVVRKIRRI